MNRPRSANDAQALVRQHGQPVVEPLGSPTKGILMTPGTAAAKKKNVTFGDNVMDNEEKRPFKSGLPDDCPGKFPSQLGDDLEKSEEPAEKGRGRSKLTEAFEEARDESRKRKSKSDKRGKKDLVEDDELAPEFAEPISESGKYWKHEYDIYRTNTQREVKKLITKQKAAKSYALTKDIQCTDLADQLKQEQKKVESLEAKTVELSSQMKGLQEKLRASQETERKHQDEIAMLKRQLSRTDSARPTSSDEAATKPGSDPLQRTSEPHDHSTATDKPKLDLQTLRARLKSRPVSSNAVATAPGENRETEARMDRETVKAENDPVQKPSEPYQPPDEQKKSRSDSFKAEKARIRRDMIQLPPSDDIWAQLDSLHSSSAFASGPTEKPPVPPHGGRAVTSGTNATPLTQLDVNKLSNGRDSKRNSSLRSLEVECKSTPDSPDLERIDSKNSPKVEGQPRQELPVPPPILPLASPDRQPVSNAMLYEAAAHRKAANEEPATPDVSIQVPTSSPFQPHPKTTPTRSSVLPAGPREAQGSKPTQPNNTKENVSPTSKQQTPQIELHVKPSVMWNSISAPQGAKRNTSVTGKDGKQVSIDRLEAARARVNARGRVTT